MYISDMVVDNVNILTFITNDGIPYEIYWAFVITIWSKHIVIVIGGS